MTDAPRPRVSVVLASLNEEEHIERCLRSVFEGTMPPGQIEAIVADGGSRDQTRAILARLAAGYPTLRVIDNPDRIAPCAFNRAIRASRSDVILLISAHSAVEPKYIETCLRTMDETGAEIVGGTEDAVPAGDSFQARLSNAVLTSAFGVGSSFRTRRRAGYVDTISPAMYRREVFERVGLFDERLVRNQDNELNSRARRDGARIWMTPAAHAHYYGRSSVGRVVRQNFGNGKFGILAWRLNPGCFTPRHAMPFAFVLFLLFGAVLALAHPWLAWVYLGTLALYAGLALVGAAVVAVRHRSPAMALVFFVFPLLHIAYGLGTLVGVFRFGFTRVKGQPPEKLPPRTEDRPNTQA